MDLQHVNVGSSQSDIILKFITYFHDIMFCVILALISASI